MSATAEETVNVQHPLSHGCKRRIGRNAEVRLDDEHVGRALADGKENVAQRRRPDLAILVLRAAGTADDEVGHRLVTVDASKTVGAGRIAAELRGIVVPTSGVPISDAGRIPSGDDRLFIAGREAPVVAEPFAERPALAGVCSAERTRSNPVLDGVTVLMQHDV